MRLTCPNCGAQYEVPDEVIPDDGRDVQCSNCGDTWFQAHPDNTDTSPERKNVAAQDQDTQHQPPEPTAETPPDVPEQPPQEPEPTVTAG